MDITICQHRDQALLCAIIAEGHAFAQVGMGTVTRRAVMTAFCYGKLAGIPTDRRFAIHPTGPICNEVLLDLDALEVDEAIRDISCDPEHHAHYMPGVGSLSLCSMHGPWVEEHRAKIKLVMQALAPLTNSHLDQVACMHYLWLYLYQTKGTAGLMQGVLVEFMRHAAEEQWAMTPEDAVLLYERLTAARIIHPGQAAE